MSEPLGEAASAAPGPVADGGACEIGDDMLESLSVSIVGKLSSILNIGLLKFGGPQI